MIPKDEECYNLLCLMFTTKQTKNHWDDTPDNPGILEYQIRLNDNPEIEQLSVVYISLRAKYNVPHQIKPEIQIPFCEKHIQIDLPCYNLM